MAGAPRGARFERAVDGRTGQVDPDEFGQGGLLGVIVRVGLGGEPGGEHPPVGTDDHGADGVVVGCRGREPRAFDGGGEPVRVAHAAPARSSRWWVWSRLAAR